MLYFFLPPEDGTRAFTGPDAPAEGWPWEYFLLLVWGHTRNFPMVAERAAPFAHASTFITVPADDMLDVPSTALLAQLEARRLRMTPEDMLAVAFNGLARRRMRGRAKVPGDDVATFAVNLRRLADALDAFNNSSPGTFFDGDEIKAVAQRDKKKR